MSTDLFEQVSRLKLRFTTNVGTLSVEDLWDLPLTSKNRPNLDDLAKTIFAALERTNEMSFVRTSSSKNPELELSFEIVKHIISVKLAENLERTTAVALATSKQKIIDLIAAKEEDKLSETSLEDLKAQLAALAD